MPWSSAISTLISRSLTVVPPPGARLDRQLGAEQQRPLPHPGDPEPALGLLEGEAAAVVGDLELDASPSARRRRRPRSARRRSGGPRWRAPPGRPGRRPAARRCRGRRSRPPRPARRRPRSCETCSTWPAIAAARPRSSRAVGRSWRASESSSRIAWLASALVSASSASSSGRRRLAHRLEAQQQAGQRLVHLVVEVARDPRPLLLLGAQRRRPGPPPFGLEPPHHAQEGELDAAPPPRSRRPRRSRAAGSAPAGSGRPSPSPRSASRAARSGAAAGPGRRQGRAPGRRARRSATVVTHEIVARLRGVARGELGAGTWVGPGRNRGWPLWPESDRGILSGKAIRQGAETR